MGVLETDSEGSTEYRENPITINSMDGDTVTFTVSQTWMEDYSIEWMATTYPKAVDEIRCEKENAVAPYSSYQYTAACVEGETTLTVYVHDEVFNTTDNPTVPSIC